MRRAMGVLRHLHRHRHRHRPFFCNRFLITALTFLVFASHISGEEIREPEIVTSLDRVVAVQRTTLAGPGSSPPTCRSKCGRCSPCKPVHVPVQPGLSIPLEYYPEAWRCKCGNKLFMP